MPKRKKAEEFASLGTKDCWHPYGLQVLTPSKFAMVVGKILRGSHSLVKPHLSVQPNNTSTNQSS